MGTKLRLTINHLDLITQGDATIIDLEKFDSANKLIEQTIVLVDGGLGAKQAKLIQDELRETHNASEIDAIVVTHYDDDHCKGIVSLLQNWSNSGNKQTLIFDRGASLPNETTQQLLTAVSQAKLPKNADSKNTHNNRRSSRDRSPKNISFNKSNQLRAEMVTVLKNKTQFVHCTENLIDNLFSFTNENLKQKNAIKLNSPDSKSERIFYLGDSLLGLDLLDIIANKGKIDEEYNNKSGPKKAISIEFVAMNQCVLNCKSDEKNLIKTYVDSKCMTDNENPKSIALKIKCNNFIYYIGGDLESPQEDKLISYLGKCSAIKTSHHGSSSASSNTFLKAVQPKAAFISCGTDNIYEHPAADVIRRLEKYTDRYYQTGYNTQETLFPSDKRVIAGVKEGQKKNIKNIANGHLLLIYNGTIPSSKKEGLIVKYLRSPTAKEKKQDSKLAWQEDWRSIDI